MNFDDRLRNHLTAQSHELDVAPEGTDAIRVRSRRRRQRRTGVSAMAAAMVVFLAAGWYVNSTDTDTANVATEGDALEDTFDEASSGAPELSSTTTPPLPLERVLPEAGSRLRLAYADNTDAPGGYNIYQSGRSNGLYYVLSTAPGVTWENAGDELIRNDTIYTFDGSDWNQNTASDRFVSTIDSTTPGLLYTVSTGSPSGQALELGTSTNAGADWSWTEVDLTSVFGPDPSSWPPYSVQFATRGNETFVLVHTNGQIDWDAAIDLAIANGAPIDRDTHAVMSVDHQGIGWFEQPEVGPCDQALTDALNAAWDAEPEGPEFDFERELTESEQAELDAYWAALDERGGEIYSSALQSVARVPGCATFVKCMTEYGELTEANDLEIQRFLDANSIENEGLDDADAATLDEMYAAFAGETQEWATSSGCDAEVPFLVSDGEAIPESSTYASWDSLGVTIPESWNGISAGFVVEGDRVTDLGRLFDGGGGFLVEVAVTDGEWTVTFDSTIYAEEDASATSVYTVWSSATGAEWTSTSADSFSFLRPTALPDGTSFTIDWREASTQVVRVTPDGQAGSLTLESLAPDIDTEGYGIMNARAGEYGVVVWAVKWNDGDGPSYDSIVLYSPDGVGWGATEVPGVEVVDVIVGDDEVVLFLNDPERADGTAQPILIGQA